MPSRSHAAIAGIATEVRPAVWPRVSARDDNRPVDMAPPVLIVDDHPSFRATARVLLEAEGFDVVGEAVDGASALDRGLPAAARGRAARRAAARHRRLRRRRARSPAHPDAPGGDPRLEPRLVGLRPARHRARARAASSPRPSSRASACRSCSAVSGLRRALWAASRIAGVVVGAGRGRRDRSSSDHVDAARRSSAARRC